jgi:hypothetical protein
MLEDLYPGWDRVSKQKVGLFLKIVGLKSPLSSSSSPVKLPQDLGHNLQECENDVLQALDTDKPDDTWLLCQFHICYKFGSWKVRYWTGDYCTCNVHLPCLLANAFKRNLFLLMLSIFLETAPNGSLNKSLECFVFLSVGKCPESVTKCTHWGWNVLVLTGRLSVCFVSSVDVKDMICGCVWCDPLKILIG